MKQRHVLRLVASLLAASIATEAFAQARQFPQFRHSMKDKQITVIGRDGKPATRDVAFNPFDLPAAHIFKVRDDRIHEIEALGFMMAYLSKGGWSDFAR